MSQQKIPGQSPSPTSELRGKDQHSTLSTKEKNKS